jgi:hypothetical protein
MAFWGCFWAFLAKRFSPRRKKKNVKREKKKLSPLRDTKQHEGFRRRHCFMERGEGEATTDERGYPAGTM